MTSSDRCWQGDQFGLSNMSGCWRIDRGLTLKLKDLRSFPHRIFDPFVPEITRNRTRPESIGSVRPKWSYRWWKPCRLRSSDRWEACPASVEQSTIVIVCCQSCVKAEIVGRRGRQASRPKSIPASVSSSLLIVGVIEKVIVEKLQTDPSSTQKCENLWE